MTAVSDIAVPLSADALRRARPTPRRPVGTVALGLLIAALAAPLLPILIWSVARGWFFPSLLPSTVSLAAWRSAFSPSADLAEALVTSLSVSVAATVLAAAVGIPAGRALGLARFPGKKAVEILVLAPILVPGIAVAMGLHAVLIRLGLAGTLAGVVLVQLVPTVPYVVLVSAAVFARFDPGYERQARLLGATPLRAFLKVTVPMLAPGLATAAAFAFLVSWSQYGLTLIVGAGRVVTLPLILGQYVSAGRNDLAAVAAVVSLVPCLAVLAVCAQVLSSGRGRV